MSSSTETTLTTIIEPPRGWTFPSLRTLWHFRDLFYFLVRRDVAVRYKQTTVGIAWAILQPVGLAIIFGLFLALLFRREPAGDIPFPVFMLCGFTLWLFFSQAVSQGSKSTVGSSQLITKVYFPRIIIPLAAVIPPAVDFVLGFVVLVVVMLLYGVDPSLNILAAPLVFLLTLSLAIGVSLWFSGLVVRFRDVELLIPFMLQVLLYASAVIYPLDFLPEGIQSWLVLNPMVGIMETFRWAMLPGAEGPGLMLLVPVVASVLLIVTGLLNFQHAERSFADVI